MWQLDCAQGQLFVFTHHIDQNLNPVSSIRIVHAAHMQLRAAIYHQRGNCADAPHLEA